MKIKLPSHIKVPNANAYLVGGSVRDLICGKPPLDYDIAVDQAPQTYAATLGKQLGSRVIYLGKKPFCVYRIVSGNTCIDITQMNGSSIEADLAARDFTINAMACDLSNGRIIDSMGGLDDLKRKLVRMVSSHALSADPIRLLRAFRMAAVMGFDIDSRTLEAIARRAETIEKSAGERVLNEIYKILACTESHRQILIMAETRLLHAIFPELIPLETCRQNRHHSDNVMNHSLNAYRQMERLLYDSRDILSGASARYVAGIDPRSQILLKLAILLHDIGKPDRRQADRSGTPHFYGHARRSVALLLPICRRLRMSNNDSDFLVHLVGHHQRPLDLWLSANEQTGRISSKATGRFFRRCGDLAPELLLHALADNMGKSDAIDACLNSTHSFMKDLLASYFDTIQPKRSEPLINGSDLINRFGLTPSPLFGSILEQVEEAYLAGNIQNRDEAFEWIADMLHPPRVT